MAIKIKIDKKDRQILFELNWDARISNSKLAKKVGLSKKGIEYRIKRLERLGVIEGYYPFINFMKLGFYYCRTFIKLQYLNESIKKEMEEFIKLNENYNWSIWALGEYDLVIGAWSKNLGDFKKNINDFIIRFDKFVKSKKFSFGIQLDQFSYNFLIEDQPREQIVMRETSLPIKIDKNDFLILKELMKNTKIQTLGLSNRMRLSPVTIKRKFKALQEQEILLAERASLNPDKIDQMHFKLLLYLNQNNDKDLKKIKQFLLSKPNLIYFVDEIGICDLDLEALFPSTNDFLNLIKELQENFSDLIKGYEYFIFRDTIKINFIPASLEKSFED